VERHATAADRLTNIERDRSHVASQCKKRRSTMVTETFEKWGRGFSGCDGGNPCGEIWLCGIEYAGGDNKESIEQELMKDVSKPPPPREDRGSFLEYRYNRSTLKILCALAGGDVHCYKEFFHSDCCFAPHSRYFKLNLYPLGFKSISPSHWHGAHAVLTGLQNKSDYQHWCQKERFPQLRSWAKDYSPKLIICTGKNSREDFFKAFCDPADTEIQDEQGIPGKPIQYAVTNAGRTLVAVTYFPGAPTASTATKTCQRLDDDLRNFFAITA
jgi:hypothetical protein